MPDSELSGSHFYKTVQHNHISNSSNDKGSDFYVIVKFVKGQKVHFLNHIKVSNYLSWMTKFSKLP